MLEKKFKTLCLHFNKNESLINELWEEIKDAHYDREYHNLDHLEYIYNSLEKIKITPIIEFAIFYHDIIYNVLKSNSEEQSAELATKHLLRLNLNEKSIQRVHQLIIETKTHQPSSDHNAIFLDADLAILSSSSKEYQIYSEKIRKEYKTYNDKEYKNGRKKLLKSLIEEENIYKSKYFRKYYEHKARINLKNELMLLS